MDTRGRGLLKQADFSNARMIFIGILAVLTNMIVANIPMSSLSLLLPVIREEMGLTQLQAASFSAGAALGTACFVFVAGVLVDKLPNKILMAIFLGGAAIVVFLRYSAYTFGAFYLLCVLLGIFYGVIVPSIYKTIALWFPKKYIFTLNSLIIGGGAIAFIIGLNTTYQLSAALGSWRKYFVVLAIVIIVLALIWLFFVPHRTSQDARLNLDIEVKNVEQDTFWQNIKNIISSPRVWMCCLADFFFMGVVGALTSLGTSTIYEMFGGAKTVAECGMIASSGNTGSLFGYITLPTILRKFFPRVDKGWPIALSMIVSGVFWALAYSGISTNLTWLIFALAFGSFWNGFGLSGPRTLLMELPEVAGLRTGTALGVFNTISALGRMVMPTLAGAMAVSMGGYTKSMGLVSSLAVLGAIFVFIFMAMSKNIAKKEAIKASIAAEPAAEAAEAAEAVEESAAE